MTSNEFVYWLRGYFEISGTKELNETQLKIIQDHLDLVFTKVTPQRDPRDNRKCEKTPLRPGEPIFHAWPTKICSSLETYC